MKMLGKRNFELIADSFRTLGFSDYRDGMMNEEQMYVDEIDEIVEFLKWLKESGMPFGSVNYEESFTAFKKATEKPKESHRSIHRDLQYLELLKSFQASHKALSVFYMEDSTDDYTLLAPQQYPFEQSLDDYLNGIHNWVSAQYHALGIKDERES